MNRVLRRGSGLACLSTAVLATWLPAADPPPKPQTEDDVYRLISFPLPADVVLEVAVSTGRTRSGRSSWSACAAANCFA